MKNYIKFVIILLIICIAAVFSAKTVFAQEDQASLILDLKNARASYDIAKQNYENDRKLFDNKAISENDFNKSKNDLLSKEVAYQKLLLRVMAQSSYVIVEKAIKYQDESGDRKVRVTLRSTMEGNQEWLEQFKEHFEVLTPEMRSNKVYNIFVSLINLQERTIIGSPYEIRIPYLELGNTAEADFTLLQDVESLQVSLNYSGRKDEKNIYLQKDDSANIVDINSAQFSQEADLGTTAKFNLTLERFSASNDVYRLAVLNLPRQVSYDFIESSTNARLSQIRFMQGENTKTLVLNSYLPERDDDKVQIDKPMQFYAIVLTRDEFAKLGNISDRVFTKDEIDKINGGKVRLELIPRGVGRIEVRAPNLYHEITVGENVTMEVTVKNTGTRRLDNIKITTDNPLRWKSNIQPDLIKSLDPEKEQIIHLEILPPDDVGVGAQEVKIKTEALADNRRVETEDKTVRIQISAKTPILGSLLLILLLVGLVVGIVIFGIKLSRR